MRWRGCVVVLAVGCSSWQEASVDGLRTLSGEFRSARDGLARVEVEVVDGETAMLVTATADDRHSVYVRELWDPTGTLVYDATAWWDLKQQLSNAAFADPETSFNWPIRLDNTELTPGVWEVALGTLDPDHRAEPREQVEVAVALKQDADFDRGDIAATIVLTGPVADDAVAREAVEAAVAEWVSLYESYGISVTTSVTDAPDVELSMPPSIGDRLAYADLSSDGAYREVRVIVAESFEQPPGLFGMAGSIPGALESTGVSAVAVSTLMHSGGDGSFSAGETRMFGETIAHEVGHYLGLFHPVEMTYGKWDALSDTPECASQGDCVSELSENLMFPFPVCSFMGDCTPQRELTLQQQAIAQRYTGVE